MALPARNQIAIWGGAFAVLALALWALGGTLLPFIAGAAVAYFLDPVADRLQRLGLGRTWAVAVISVSAAGGADRASGRDPGDRRAGPGAGRGAARLHRAAAGVSWRRGCPRGWSMPKRDAQALDGARIRCARGDGDPEHRARLLDEGDRLRDGGAGDPGGGDLSAARLGPDGGADRRLAAAPARAGDPAAGARHRPGAGGVRAGAGDGLPDPRGLLRHRAGADRAALGAVRGDRDRADLVHSLRRVRSSAGRCRSASRSSPSGASRSGSSRRWGSSRWGSSSRATSCSRSWSAARSGCIRCGSCWRCRSSGRCSALPGC
jgi:hypothetical protein